MAESWGQPQQSKGCASLAMGMAMAAGQALDCCGWPPLSLTRGLPQSTVLLARFARDMLASTAEDIARKRAGKSAPVGKPTLAQSWGQPQQSRGCASRAMAAGQALDCWGWPPLSLTRGLPQSTVVLARLRGDILPSTAEEVARKRAGKSTPVGKPTLAQSGGQPQQDQTARLILHLA